MAFLNDWPLQNTNLLTPHSNTTTMTDNEMKARFFAAYLGQKVEFFEQDYNQTGEQYLHAIQIAGCGDTNEREFDFKSMDCYLLLRSIQSLTDEECCKCQKILKPNDDYKHSDPSYFRSWVKTIDNSSWLYSNTLIFTDYLRSIGIAIPFMGISVEEMIKKGWIKLID